ncbi:LysR family transcriptional regulator [Cognatishimia maritima]|uniref:DNA-binding transcriptional regulator, LysR family n=1 Tax=Cognatishimia maritima TaxID=870908 RepID=A0A1M5W079_9RHOB|nr:LysR family transcriptional regulator [Cognatishimia maritima]SHH80840.1 DNA-binding transcriptional regulator, LysR family [Cognatishimia maritima]
MSDAVRDFDWDGLRTFLAISRSGSLRGASVELGVNHATVRRALEKLERSLGTRLFDRSDVGLALTQPGEALLDHAYAVEDSAGAVLRSVAGLDAVPKGTVKVSMPPSFAGSFFTPILASFASKYPDINVEVVGTNKFSDLTRNEADVAIRASYKVDDDVIGRRLVRYVVGAYATPEYVDRFNLATGTPARGAEWVGWGGSTSWVKSTPFPGLPVRHALFEIFMQIEAAAAGLGIVWVPAFLADSDPRLIRVPNTETKPDRSIWLLLHADLRQIARVRALVDHVADYVSARRAQFTN